MDKSKIASGVRFFGTNLENVPHDLRRLDNFLGEAAQYGEAYVAVNTSADVTNALAHIAEQYPEVIAFGVTPWQKFIAPCNALIYAAAVGGAHVFLSASAEFPLKKEYVDQLMPHLDDDTLFVGARFPEHKFSEGEHIATGSSFPWGTFGIWNLVELAKFGMPLCGDAPFNSTKAGVEELSTVGMFQERFNAGLSTFEAKAKLVTMNQGFYGEWNMDGWDEARFAAHMKKIASKSERPAAQLAWAGIRAPQVIHIA